MTDSKEQSFANFREFWPFYLGEHSTLACRIQHFFGASLALAFVFVSFVTLDWRWLVLAVVCGYGFAWCGHFVFEKNRPATFRFPVYSFMGDWKMFWMMLVGSLDQEILRLGVRHKSV
jgi:hypothetical protein